MQLVAVVVFVAAANKGWYIKTFSPNIWFHTYNDAISPNQTSRGWTSRLFSSTVVLEEQIAIVFHWMTSHNSFPFIQTRTRTRERVVLLSLLWILLLLLLLCHRLFSFFPLLLYRLVSWLLLLLLLYTCHSYVAKSLWYMMISYFSCRCCWCTCFFFLFLVLYFVFVCQQVSTFYVAGRRLEAISCVVESLSLFLSLSIIYWKWTSWSQLLSNSDNFRIKMGLLRNLRMFRQSVSTVWSLADE